MILIQLVRLAVIVLVAVAFVARNTWPGLFVWVRINLLWLILAYAFVTLLVRAIESRHRDTRFGRLVRRIEGLFRRPEEEKPSGPWSCQVCETENPAEEIHCQKCTVPRPVEV